MPILSDETQKLNSGEVLLDLIQINHSELTEPFYLVVNNEDIIHNGVIYTAVGVSIKEPGQGEKIPRAEISVCNVDLKLMDIVQNINEEPEVILKQIYASQPDVVVRTIGTFRMKSVNGNHQVLTFELSFDGLSNKGYPEKDFNSRDFPGLYS